MRGVAEGRLMPRVTDILYIGSNRHYTKGYSLYYTALGLLETCASTYPSVVMVTMVYQKAAGMLVNLVAVEPFSA